MTIIPYVIYLLLVGLHAVILREVTGIYTAEINLAAFLVLAVVLYKDDRTAAWFALFAGLVAAAGGPPEQMGWHALMMVVVALAGCFARERLNLDALKAKLLLILGGVLISNIGALIITRTDGLLIYLLSSALAGAVYTTAVAWLFFLVKEKRLTMERIKALF